MSLDSKPEQIEPQLEPKQELAKELVKRFIIVAGTWAFDGADKLDEWWQPESPFVKFVKEQGYDYVLVDGQPFVWSTALEGISILQWFGKKAKHSEWRAAAINFKQYISTLPLKDRNVIAHSHGGQVIAFACAAGAEINNLITISMPIRGDMKKTYALAAPNIAYWTHIYSNKSDWIQVLGGLFDGSFGVKRKCEYADMNIMIPGIGHSDLFSDPREFKKWTEMGLLRYLGHV